MWLCLNNAFLSIVDKSTEPGCLLVRCRRTGDIARVFPTAAVREQSGTDYLYRADIPRAQVAAKVAELVMEIDYNNFKNSVSRDHDDLHSAYNRVWSTMADLQPVAPYSR